MAKKPPYIPPGLLAEVSNRAVGSRFLLKPSREANELIAGVLARLYEWQQELWSRRHSAIVVSREPEAQIGRLKYLIGNTVKEQLVEKVSHWPGLHAAKQILEGEDLVGTWVNRTYLYRQGRSGKKIDPEKARETETLKLSLLPCWKKLSPDDYRSRIAELVSQVEEEARIEREASGKRVPGRKAVLRQHAHYPPPREKRSPIPLHHAASRETRKRFREAFKVFLDAYRIASGRLREGSRDVAFPEGSFPPALPFVPSMRAGPVAP